MNKCLYCYKELRPGEVDFHPECARKMFGTSAAPELPYSRDNMSELASKVIKTSTSVTGVQAKLSLEIDRGRKNEPSRFTIVGLWGNYILKPQSPQYRSLPELEDLTMKMAETAKILSPDTTVLMPRPDAGCPMADMVDVEKLRKFRAANPDTVIIAYVNTTAEVKSLVDICCTSGNAEKVVASIPADKEILFMPDRNLGGNIMRKLGRKMLLWEGCCPYHDGVTVEMISRQTFFAKT